MKKQLPLVLLLLFGFTLAAQAQTPFEARAYFVFDQPLDESWFTLPNSDSLVSNRIHAYLQMDEPSSDVLRGHCSGHIVFGPGMRTSGVFKAYSVLCTYWDADGDTYSVVGEASMPWDGTGTWRTNGVTTGKYAGRDCEGTSIMAGAPGLVLDYEGACTDS